MSIKPLVFTAMPFGRKPDPSNTYEIDFDDIYKRSIVPATQDVNLDVIRADEERMGGFIHLPMYERLLLAEIVIADLTLANPNVFYELGIRHAARPRATIMIFNEGATLPFDVRPLRAIPYRLNNEGKLSDTEADTLRKALAQKLKEALEDDISDSPLFHLIPNFPGIELPHEVTESFRDRAKYIDSLRGEIEKARFNKESGVEELNKIRTKLKPFKNAPPELLVDLLLAYRDLESWDNMINLVSEFPTNLMEHRTIQEQLAFALNRRNQSGDRDEAIQILKKVISLYGSNPETCGILGRVYKDLYSDAIKAGKKFQAEGFLDESIRWYKKGFEADPRDYYPGINAAMLLFEKGDEESLSEMESLIPVLQFAIGRRGGLSSHDYWDVATVLQLSILGQNWDFAVRAAQRFGAMATHAWSVKTTVDDLKRMKQTMIKNGRDTSCLSEIISNLEEVQRTLP
ncbi:TRAFs-binding domain-containing protein [Anoxybacteroides rupiense]|uniref:TRAFs-binding domain-containing protein n=1 Tax=Anoxybacteroides rupiense TaxID=311460 RepID=UPI00366E1A51